MSPSERIANDRIVMSLEQLAGSGDVTELLYQRFAARCPEHAALMDHMDSYMLGRMMSDVLTLVMSDPATIDPGYLSFEVTSHHAYGVTPDMFPPLLEVVRDVSRERLGARWDAGLEAAWAERLRGLETAIAAASAEA